MLFKNKQLIYKHLLHCSIINKEENKLMFADVSPLLIVLLLKKRLSIKIASFLFLSKSKKIGLDIKSKPK